jgi:hypothetical protein
MSLQHDIRRLAFFKYLIGDGVTLEQATRDAGRELAQERKRKPLVSHDRTAAPGRSAGGIRAELMRKLFDGLNRLREAPAKPQLVPHVLDRDSVAAPPVVVTKTEQIDPPANQIIGVFVGNASGAELIDQADLPPRYFDRVTDNWRRSIERNERIARQNGRWIG